MGTHTSIGKITKYMSTHTYKLCLFCIWTHIFTDDIISVQGGKEAFIFRRPITTKKEDVPMSEKKSTYTGQTDARRKASAKYLKESVEDIRIRVPKGDKAKVQEHAASIGESMNSFAVRVIKDEMSNVTLPLNQSITFNENIQEDLEKALMNYGSDYMTGYSRESSTDGSAKLILKFKNKECISDKIIKEFITILENHGINVLPK